MPQNKKFILFDFDGVIADSYEAAFEVERLICPDITETIYRRRFEGNINDWEDPMHGHTGACRHDISFFDEYIPRMKERVKVVPGIEKVIEELAKSNTLIIISSTITSPINDFIESHGMTKYFTEVMGNDVHKSKVEKIKMVFEKHDASPKDCIFITDTLGDMREAEKTGVGAIGVSWGFQHKETLAKGNPFRIVDNPHGVLSAVSDYFGTQASLIK
jgi:HAD superfamily hydrolase (TIGR01509 family)